MNRRFMILALGALTLALSSCRGNNTPATNAPGSWNSGTAIWDKATWQ